MTIRRDDPCPLRRYLREEARAWGLVALVCLLALFTH